MPVRQDWQDRDKVVQKIQVFSIRIALGSKPGNTQRFEAYDHGVLERCRSQTEGKNRPRRLQCSQRSA